MLIQEILQDVLILALATCLLGASLKITSVYLVKNATPKSLFTDPMIVGIKKHREMEAKLVKFQNDYLKANPHLVDMEQIGNGLLLLGLIFIILIALIFSIQNWMLTYS